MPVDSRRIGPGRVGGGGAVVVSPAHPAEARLTWPSRPWRSSRPAATSCRSPSSATAPSAPALERLVERARVSPPFVTFAGAVPPAEVAELPWPGRPHDLSRPGRGLRPGGRGGAHVRACRSWRAGTAAACWTSCRSGRRPADAALAPRRWRTPSLDLLLDAGPTRDVGAPGGRVLARAARARPRRRDLRGLVSRGPGCASRLDPRGAVDRSASPSSASRCRSLARNWDQLRAPAARLAASSRRG